MDALRPGISSIRSGGKRSVQFSNKSTDADRLTIEWFLEHNAVCCMCGVVLDACDCQNLRKHPRLGVVVCMLCYSAQQQKDIGTLDCVWCGVEVAAPNFRSCVSPACSNKLCDRCLRANFSRFQVEAMCETWTCFNCDPQSIEPHQLYADCVMEFARKFRRPLILDRSTVMTPGRTTRARLLNSIKELLMQLKEDSTAPPSTENLDELIELARTLRTELSTAQISHVRQDPLSQSTPIRAESRVNGYSGINSPDPEDTGNASRVTIKQEVCDAPSEVAPPQMLLPDPEGEDTRLAQGDVKIEPESTQLLERRERSSDADSDETINLQPEKAHKPSSDAGIDDDDELNRLLGNVNRRHYGNNKTSDPDAAEKPNVPAPKAAPSNVKTYEEPFLSSDEESEVLNNPADNPQASRPQYDGPVIILSSDEEFLDYNSPDGDEDEIPSPSEFKTPEGSSDEFSTEENEKTSTGNDIADKPVENGAGKVIARRGSVPSIPRMSPTPHHSGRKNTAVENAPRKAPEKRKRRTDEGVSDELFSDLESAGSDEGETTESVKSNAKAPPSEKKLKRRIASDESDSENEFRNTKENKPSPKKFTKQCVQASKTHAPVDMSRRHEPETCIISSDDEDFITPISKTTIKAESVTPTGRKNIREMLSRAQLSKATLDANTREKERRKRIEEMQKKYNQFELSEQAKGEETRCVLEFDLTTEEPLIEVHPRLSKRMKTHQVEGVKFLYQNLVEKASKLAENSPGTGAILGHCMGLGKTFQIVCFLHTLMTHPKLKDHFKRVLVVSPLNVIATWQEEILRWVERDPEISEKLMQYSLHKQNQQPMRLALLSKWERLGGIMLMTPNLLTSLLGRETAAGKRVKTRPNSDADATQRFKHYLCDPGPEVLIVDEGHTLKKSSTQLTQIVDKMIKTKRKILLTGTPLQNNLTEYFTMVSIVSPLLLGTKVEYRNRFEHPITNGQYKNSTPADIRKMRQRASVLKKLLENVVHRRDLSVLQSILPPRLDYVITIRLSDLQEVLYKNFLDILISKAERQGNTSLRRLLQDFVSLRSVWTHPKLLTMPKKFLQKKKPFATVSDILGFDSITTNAVSDDPHKDWFKPFIANENLEDPTLGPKIFILCDIIQNCGMIGDKLVVFCTQLSALDLVEFILGVMNENRIGEGRWIIEKDYFRMDGKTSAEDRHRFFKMFNNPSNTRARLFLVSTNAGKLGSTLVGANRMVLLDTSWNPADDNQAVYRIYRIGQTKPVFIYRFVAFGTMEEKIYARNILKESTSCRVLDDSNMERHFTHEDVRDLYTFTPFNEAERKTPGVPKDKMLAELILRHPKLIVNVHEHQQLLQNLEDDLSEEDRKIAWDEYHREKEAPACEPPPANPIPLVVHLSSSTSGNEQYLRSQLQYYDQLWNHPQVITIEQKNRICAPYRNVLVRYIEILEESRRETTIRLSDALRRHGVSPMVTQLVQENKNIAATSELLERRLSEVNEVIRRMALTPIPNRLHPPQFHG